MFPRSIRQLSFLFFLLPALASGQPTELFDPEQWEVFIGVPHTSITGLAQNDDYNKGTLLGLNNDPKKGQKQSGTARDECATRSSRRLRALHRSRRNCQRKHLSEAIEKSLHNR
jgi:hypothetical protein